MIVPGRLDSIVGGSRFVTFYIECKSDNGARTIPFRTNNIGKFNGYLDSLVAARVLTNQLNVYVGFECV